MLNINTRLAAIIFNIVTVSTAAFATTNQVVVFVPNRDMGRGEHSKYSTLKNIQRYLKENEQTFPKDSIVLGLGARYGTKEEPLAHAAEIFIHSSLSGPLSGVASKNLDGQAEELGPDDHLG